MSAPVPTSLVFTPPAVAREFGETTLRVVSAREDRAQLIAVRHAAFRQAGRLEPKAGVEDSCDDADHTVHVGAFKGATAHGAMRVTMKSWTDPISVLPCAAHFPAICSAGLRKLSIMEMSHLATDPRLGEQAGAAIHAALVRAALLAAQAARIAMLVTAAPAGRAAYYGQLLRFHPIGTPAPYPPGSELFTLTGGSMVGAAGRSIARHSFFVTAEHEIASMRSELLRCLSIAPNTRQPFGAGDGARPNPGRGV